MKINNKPVHKSEFEYLYHKNNSQQLQPQSLDEYVDMFVNYKLKVADAEAAGLDTTASFRDEFNRFRFELAEPYLKETAVIDSLVEAAYKHFTDQRYVRHIMLPMAPEPDIMKENSQRADSLRNALINGTADWDASASKFSVDRGSANKGGIMGWMPQGRYPYAFEDMVYQTQPGQISPVVNSGYGFHIIRVDSIKPNPGEVHAQHILKLTQNLDSAAAEAVAFQIDSLYKVVTQPGVDFADVAKRESQDPGSASKGGDLGWFGTGIMIKPFEDASFALADGEISKPIKTRYGYHIIKRLESRGVAPLEEMRPRIERQIQNDERAGIPLQAKTDRLIKQYNAKIDESAFKKLEKLIGADYDSTDVAALSASNITIYKIGKTKVPVKDIMSMMPITADTTTYNALRTIRQVAQRSMQQRLVEAERDELLKTNAEYRNLVGEYRDGILLFARASELVWDRPSSDPEALEKYFAEHKSEYHWDKPKFKGFIIMTKNDSTLNAARVYTDSLTTAGTQLSPSEFVKNIRQHFGRDIKVERVIAGKGDNAITDFLAFGAPKPEDNPSGWNFYYTYSGKIIEQPEEAADVRSQVTTDFQNMLEKQWIADLRAKYPVTIDQNVLKTVK